jgi:hypothetical protein
MKACPFAPRRRRWIDSYGRPFTAMEGSRGKLFWARCSKANLSFERLIVAEAISKAIV